MKIQSVKYKNFRNVPNIEKEINGRNILLIGDNGVGKSNFIKAILIALGVIDAGENPITDGESTGSIQVVTDDKGNQYKFITTFIQGKDPKVEVVCPDGVKQNKKSVLASIVGSLDFDIDKFVEMSATKKGRKDMVEVVKTFLPNELRQGIAEIEAKLQRWFDERTELTRQQRMYAEKVKTTVVDPKYKTPVNVTELNEEYRQALHLNNGIKLEQEKIETAKLRIDEIPVELSHVKDSATLRIKALNKQIEMLKSQIKAEQVDLDKKESELKMDLAVAKAVSETKLPSLTPVQPILDKINSAQYHNEQHLLYKQFQDDIRLRDELTEEIGEKTVLIDTSREAVREAIREEGLPVEGLEFDNEQLLWNDRPVDIENMSTSEIMELGIRLRMARNPNVHVMTLERGESIGSQRWKEIQSLAKKYDWQIIAEKMVADSEGLTIEIMKEL